MQQKPDGNSPPERKPTLCRRIRLRKTRVFREVACRTFELLSPRRLLRSPRYRIQAAQAQLNPAPRKPGLTVIQVPCRKKPLAHGVDTFHILVVPKAKIVREAVFAHAVLVQAFSQIHRPSRPPQNAQREQLILPHDHPTVRAKRLNVLQQVPTNALLPQGVQIRPQKRIGTQD